MKRLLFCLFLVLSQAKAANIDIDVVALYKDAVLLDINGERRLLRQGQRTVEGITLISAHSREAIIELGGRQITLNLSSRIGTEFKPPDTVTVSIGLNDNNQYRTTGSINNRPVSFVVDTGANIMALNAGHANSLGINYERVGRKADVETAGGRVGSWGVTLDVVQVGEIKVRNVRAVVIEGDYPTDILLGMTFLRSVEMNETSGVLVLKSKLGRH